MSGRSRKLNRSLGALACAALVVAGCSSDDAASPESSETPSAESAVPETAEAADERAEVSPPDSAEPEPADTEPPDTTGDTAPAPPDTEPAPEPAEVRVPDVAPLADLGGGTLQPLATAPLPDGYSEAEFSLGGEASSYTALDDLETDGTWDSVESGVVAPYTTRMIVRTPPAEAFSGVVLVEWMNVTAGTDTTPDWGFLHEMIGREGHGYVAVSAQFVGVMGDDESFIEGGLIDTNGLPVKDPVRYGDLNHPGDEFAYDVFTQAGVAVSDSDVLGGLEPASVIALGESQSAFFMTGYVNAVHPLVDVYDGFLVHSRGATGTAPDGQRGADGLAFTHIRTDLNVPVLQYATETDLFALGFQDARQPDTDSVRTWEVAGTAHADAYSLFASGLPRSPDSGSILGCSTPINDGPQHETLAAATHHLVAWVSDGTLPPISPQLDVEVDGVAFVRDAAGVATGGVRTPVVDAPLRVLSGDPGPDEGSCFLFGQTLPLGDGVLDSLYAGSLESWAGAAQESADAAVEAGWLLPEDAASMLAEARERAVLLGLS